MQMPEGYQVPDDPDAGRMDAAYLRTCLGISTPLSGAPPELPLEVRRAHFHVSHALRRLGAWGRTGMDATQIAMVVALAEMQGDVVKEVPKQRDFHDDIEEGLVEEGGKVVIVYRSREQPGHFLRVEGSKIIVLHDGNERKLSSTSVRIPEKGEFPGVADNIVENCRAE